MGKKSEQRWLWYAIDHTTKVVLAYVFGRRTDGSGLNLGFAVNIHAKFNFVNKQANDSIMH